MNSYKCLHNPFKIVRMFEEEVAHYTGAPYAVSVDSCTSALMLVCKYLQGKGSYHSKQNLFKCTTVNYTCRRNSSI
jgi:dTDP-4-amino-4,6-dideoxygalactose transaminase